MLLPLPAGNRPLLPELGCCEEEMERRVHMHRPRDAVQQLTCNAAYANAFLVTPYKAATTDMKTDITGL